MGVTIYDIAKEAAVGIGTVSRALNNHPNVSDDTKHRVLSVARRLNYQPHAYAQGLARKRTNTLSVIMPFFTNYFFVEVLQGVQDKVTELGYDLMLHGVNQPDQVDAYLRRATQRGRVDGVLYCSMQLPEPYAEKFQQLKLPVVLVDAHHEAFDSITVENTEGAYAATEHLIRQGHTRLGMINAQLESLPARERLAGFRQAMLDNGLKFNPDHLKISRITKQDGFSRDAGYDAMQGFLAMPVADRPTAIFVSSDVQAIGALNALRDAGLRAPDDMAVIGFDDIELARHLGLSTMRQPMYRMGMLAVERIVERLTKPETSPLHMSFSPTLVVRETCGAARQPERAAPALIAPAARP